MRERIIVANNLSENELLRTLSKNNINTLGMRIKRPLELAKDALLISNYNLEEEYLNNNEISAIIYSFLNEIKYFENASYNDAKNLCKTINIIRNLCVKKDIESFLLDDAEFIEKNKAILEVYKRYKKYCLDNKKIDEADIKLLALNKIDNIDNEYIILKEYPLSPLDYALLNKISNNDLKEISIKELFNKEKEDKEIKYIEAYGNINEAEYIIASIINKNIPLDKCQIICVNNKYIQLFIDLINKHNIPTTFNTGRDIKTSNPALLLRSLFYFDNMGYNGIDALTALFNNKAFDLDKLKGLFEEDINDYELKDIINIMGSLRISFNINDNKERIDAYKKIIDKKAAKILDKVEVITNEFNKGLLYILNEYVILRDNFDSSALNTINNDINIYTSNIKGSHPYEIIEDILDKYVGKENSKEGYLNITNLNNALATLRDHNFICGLNADNFPGNPKEDYLLLDNDLKIFKDERIVPTSINKINLIKDNFYNFIDLARHLNKNIYLSYSNFNLAELKQQNPSSLLFDLYEDINGNKTIEDFENEIKKISFFNNKLSSQEDLMRAYTQNKNFNKYPKSKELDTDINLLKKRWSPSSLELFFSCPRRFYLRKVKGIAELESDNPFDLMSPAVVGDLAHLSFEMIANKNISKEEFIKIANDLYDRYLISRPPLLEAAVERNKAEFIEMMENAYDLDPQNEVITAEDDYEAKHPSGVILYGKPDRVEKNKDGKNIIADYKTKRHIEHQKDDIDSCLQVILYAFMCEANGIKIDHSVYRYLRYRLNIECKNDEEIKESLNEKLEEFVRAIKENDFKANKKNCDYCTYTEICKHMSDKEKENG